MLLYDWIGRHSSQKKPSVYQGHRCFIFSPERTRPCRMLNNFHVCSRLPRLIMELSPSTVEPTPSSYSALCFCAPSCCDLIWKWLYADAPCQNLYKQTNAEGKKQSKEQSGLKGKQMPNIAFHKPKKHARKSKMYSCKTKKRLYSYSVCKCIPEITLFLAMLRFPVISLRSFMVCELWCSIGPIAYSPFHLLEHHYMRTKPNKSPLR